MHRGSAEARSEQLGCSPPDLHSTENSRIHNQEYEGHGLGVQQPSETTPQRTFGGGQDGRIADDLVQSGKSKGKSRCCSYAAIRTDHY